MTDLEYLNACIEEALRVHPPVPLGLLRTVPDSGDFIDGYWVPGGTTVSVGRRLGSIAQFSRPP